MPHTSMVEGSTFLPLDMGNSIRLQGSTSQIRVPRTQDRPNDQGRTSLQCKWWAKEVPPPTPQPSPSAAISHPVKYGSPPSLINQDWKKPSAMLRKTHELRKHPITHHLFPGGRNLPEGYETRRCLQKHPPCSGTRAFRPHVEYSMRHPD